MKSLLARLVAVLVAGFSLSALSSAPADDASALPAPLQAVVASYIKIQTALAKDSIEGGADAAKAIAKDAAADPKTFPAEIVKEADAVAKAADLKTMREAFKPLSASLVKVVDVASPKTKKLYEASCPMAQANWLQTSKEIRNPYYGSEMLECGAIDKEF